MSPLRGGLPWATCVRAPNRGPMTLDGTNTWVLRSGEAGALVVDPGPLDERHLQAVAAHAPVQVVVLTHRHADHSAGAARFAQMVGARVFARDPAYGDPLPTDGGALAGVTLPVTVVDTPGHSADSVCLLVAADPPALLTGDTVLGRGSTVIEHPGGRLGSYLRSLHRLRALVADAAVAAVLPGHGPIRTDAAELIDGYLAHRADRLEAVRAAVAAGAGSAAEVVRVVYADVDRALWPAAELSVRAQLDYLAEAG